MQIKHTSRIALVCDWLTTPGGAEKVLLELHRMYPDAPIYTSQYSKKGINWFDDATVKTGWLQIFPKSLRKLLGPLRQLYFSHLDLSSYDLVISVTGAEAKSVRTRPRRGSPHTGAYHLCYCHVPTQYYWQMYDKYLENPGFGFLNPLVRACFKLLVKPLRQADYRAAQQPDQFVTISSYAQDQIKKYYNRESAIVSPNVDVAKFRPQSFTDNFFHSQNSTFPQESSAKSTSNPPHQSSFSTKSTSKSTAFSQDGPELSTKTNKLPTDPPQVFHKFSTSFPQVVHRRKATDSPSPRYLYQPHQPHVPPKIICPQPPQYYIISCRQVTWKRVDLAIEACKQLQVPLLVVGDGSEHQALVRLADNSKYIKFLPWATSDELAQYLQHAKAYLFPSLEPFGIAAVEALAAGCPVIAFAEGGSRDIVKDRQNGLLFDAQTPASLAAAIQTFSTLNFDRQQVSASADRFDTEHFRQGIKKLVKRGLAAKEVHTNENS